MTKYLLHIIIIGYSIIPNQFICGQDYFEKYYETAAKANTARSVISIYDNSFLMCGATKEGQNEYDLDFLLIKADSAGNLIWRNHFGRERNDKAYSIVATPDSGYAICGQTQQLGGYKDLYIARFDKNDVMLWDTVAGGEFNEYGLNIQLTNDSGFIVVGYFQKEKYSILDTLDEHDMNKDSINSDVYLVKFDKNGILEWENTYGGIFAENGRGVKQTADGGYVVAGNTQSMGNGENDMYLIKTDANGNVEWEKTYGDAWADKGYAVDISPSGEIIVSGYTIRDGAKNAYLVKADEDGDLIWEKFYSDPGYLNNLRSVKLNKDGTIIAGGNSQSDATGLYDAVFIKVDATGKGLWRKKYGGNSEERCYNVNYTSDNNYLLVGSTRSFGTDSVNDVYFVKSLNCDQTEPIDIEMSSDNDYFDCDSLSVYATDSLSNYLWSTGNTLPQITIKSSGDYFATTSTEKCIFSSDTQYVSIINPVSNTLIDTVLIAGCSGNFYNLKFNRDRRDFDELLWNNSVSLLDSIQVYSPQTITLDAVSNECGTFSDVLTINQILQTKPATFTYDYLNNDSIHLLWDKVLDADQYKIEAQVIGEDSISYTTVFTAGKTITDLKCCMNYIIKLHVKCDTGWVSSVSPIVIAMPQCESFSCNYSLMNLFNFYPNPTHTELNIDFIYPGLSPVEFSIIDMTGNLLYFFQQETYQSIVLNISTLSNGLYMLIAKADKYYEYSKLVVY